MATLATQKKSIALPIIIGVLVLAVLGAVGYVIYSLYFQEEEAIVPVGQGLDTTALDSDSLHLVQYESGEAPVVTEQDIGRDNPFAPF